MGIDRPVTVRRTYDIELILAVQTDQKIWATIAEDGHDAADQQVPDPVNNIWLALDTEQGVIGAVYLHQKYVEVVQAHIHILPEYRRDFSKFAGESIIEWILNNTPFKIIYTEVPALYSNVVTYLKSFGFEEIGQIRACYTKNQTKHDVLILTKTLC